MAADRVDNGATDIAVRTSNRVRRPPDHYGARILEGSKRKRFDGSRADDTESEDSQPESEEETSRTAARIRRQKQRKIGVTSAQRTTNRNIKRNSLPFRNSKREPVRNTWERTAEPHILVKSKLHQVISRADSNLEEVAALWARSFAKDQPKALAEIINLVLSCAGCVDSVNEFDVIDADAVTSKLDDVRNKYQASNPTDYPLIARGRDAHGLKERLAEFIRILFETIAATKLLYEEPSFIENLHIWISTMSSAPNRSFRHTATVASLNIVTALCNIARENADEVAKDRRHAEGEKKKARINRGRVTQLEDKFRSRIETQNMLETLLKDWFDTVFIHRYRDVDPLIRRDCMAALGDWVGILPSMFLDGAHLRYFGWVLSDPNNVTRGEVVRQLLKLYQERSMLGGLKTFTEKFRPRLVEIAASDADVNIRIAGINLLNHLRESGLLEPDDIDDIGRLIFDTERRIRKAVAPFFVKIVEDLHGSKMDQLGGVEVVSEALPDFEDESSDGPQPIWLMMKSLAETLHSYDDLTGAPSREKLISRGVQSTRIQTSVESRYSLAADAVYAHIREIQPWRQIATFLLHDYPSRTHHQADSSTVDLFHEHALLTDEEEIIMLHVLITSVKREFLARSAQINATRKTSSKRIQLDLQEEQDGAARSLMDLIPKLLKRFGDTSSAAAAVLRLESLLADSAFGEARKGLSLNNSLLDDVQKQFLAHNADEVLISASAAILHAKSYSDLDEFTDEKIAGLWEEIMDKFSRLLTSALSETSPLNSADALVDINSSLTRLARLSAVSDCTSYLESVMRLTNAARWHEGECTIDAIIWLVSLASHARSTLSEDCLHSRDELSATAADTALFYFRWKIKSIISRVTGAQGKAIPYDELEKLAKRRDTYVEALKSGLDAVRSCDAVSISLASAAIEIHVSMAILQYIDTKPDIDDDYTALVLNCGKDLQCSVMKVFGRAERELARSTGRALQDDSDEDSSDIAIDQIEDDPLSEPEDQDEHTDQTLQSSQMRNETKQLQIMLAEQTLCSLTGTIIQAIFANVVDTSSVTQRVLRNRNRLGASFKECVSYLSEASEEPRRRNVREFTNAQEQQDVHRVNRSADHEPDGADDRDGQSDIGEVSNGHCEVET